MNAQSSPPTAVVLIAHGSTDPQWREPFDALINELRQRAPSTTFELAFLSKGDPNIQTVVQDFVAQGHNEISLSVALMSGGGGHFKTDVPAILEQLQQRHPGLQLNLIPEPLGATPEVIAALASACLRTCGFS